MTNTCFLKYNKELSQESHNRIHMLITLFERTTLSRTMLLCAKRKHRRFWIAMNCRKQASVKDSFDFELQSRLHLDVITLLLNKGEVWLFSVGTYHLDVPAFFVARKSVDNWMTDWMGYDFEMTVGFPKSRKTFWGEEEQRNEWVFVQTRKWMIWSLWRRERNNAAWQGAGTAFGQNGRKDRNNGSDDVADRNKQGNCIDSFRFHRQSLPITLWGIPQSP